MAGKYDRAKPNQETSCSSLSSSSQITETQKRGKVKSEEAEANGKGNVVPRTYTLNGSRQESVSTVTPTIERRRDGFDSSRMWQDVMTAGLNDIGRLHQIKKFVKDNLFPHVKFFVSEHELAWSVAPKSISSFVVKGLHISNDLDVCREWWNNNCGLIVKELNRKRSDVVSGMRRIFLCK
jgi:hypothetical protein